MSERRRFFANLFWLVGEKILRVAVGFAVLGLIARHVGPEAFGSLNFALGLAAVFLALATLGLDTVVVRELVRFPTETHAILGTAFVLRLTGAALAIGCLLAGAPWLTLGTDGLRMLIAIASLTLLWQPFDVIDLWFQKNLQSRHTVSAKLFALGVGSLVRLWLIARGAPVAWFCWAFVLDGFVGAAVLLLVYRQQGGRVGTWRFSLVFARTLLVASWPLVTSGLLIALYLRLDQMFVLGLLGPRELGFYSAAGKVSELWLALGGFALTSIFPLLAARHVRADDTYPADLQFAFDAMAMLGYAFAVLVSLAAPLLVTLVFGEPYRPAAEVLTVLVWSAPFLCTGGVRAHYFLLENATVYHNWTAALGLAANAVLAFALIPRFGSTGAALAVVLSSVLSAWLSSWLFSRLRPCARLQTAALLLPFRPHAWAGFVHRFR